MAARLKRIQDLSVEADKCLARAGDCLAKVRSSAEALTGQPDSIALSKLQAELDKAAAIQEQIRDAIAQGPSAIQGVILPSLARYLEPEYLLEKLTQLSPFATFIIDGRSSSLDYVSPNIDRLLGYSQQEILAMGPRFYETVYDPNDMDDTLPKRKGIAALKDGERETQSNAPQRRHEAHF